MTPEEAKEIAIAYKRVFRSAAGQTVLKDLAQFCRAFDTPFHENPRLTDVTIGRGEVWHRICNMIDVKMDDYFRLRRQQPIDTTFEDEI